MPTSSCESLTTHLITTHCRARQCAHGCSWCLTIIVTWATIPSCRSVRVRYRMSIQRQHCIGKGVSEAERLQSKPIRAETNLHSTRNYFGFRVAFLSPHTHIIFRKDDIYLETSPAAPVAFDAHKAEGYSNAMSWKTRAWPVLSKIVNPI